MKKILAVIGIFAVIFTLASCKRNLTPAEVEASYAAEHSKAQAEYESRIVASIKQEEDIVEFKAQTLESLGKTEKGKQIVFKSSSGIEQYEVIKVGKSGKAESWVRYTYFNDAEEFEIAKKGSKSGNFKIVDSDKDLRVIVYENKNKKLFEGTDFDTMLKNVRDFGYTVVE
ncbi:MAG: hypothetical protein IKB88_08645 [Clostridia bacterium]|nr:hypothetical protein [Clostridia bacterium]